MRSTLRVCWIVPGFPAAAADPRYTFLAREASELVATGQVELTIVTESPFDEHEPRDYEVLRLRKPTRNRHKACAAAHALAAEPRRLPGFVRSPARSQAVLWRTGELIRLLRRRRLDVLHSHFAAPMGTAGVPIARAVGASAVVSLRGADVVTDSALGYGLRLDPAFDLEIRRSLPRSDLCLTATGRMRRIAIEAGAAPERTCVLPNSFDRSWLASPVDAPRPREARHLYLSVGHLTPGKGFDRGIRALAELSTGSHYVIVGEGPDRARLERLATDIGVQDRTHFPGAASPSEVAGWMAQADVYWFPSRVEAFGNVLLEAYASGLPIVATAEGVAPELVDGDPSCHLLARADDQAELAALSAQAVVAEVPQSHRCAVIARYAADVRSAQLIDAYGSLRGRELVRRSRGRRRLLEPEFAP